MSDLMRSGRTAAENAKAHANDEVIDPTSSHFPPFIMNKPFSEKADKIGLSDGEMISLNAEEAVKLQKMQSHLNDNVSGDLVKITLFKNWGDTQEALLLHAKPTTVKQVQDIVKAACKYEDSDGNKGIKMGMGGSYHSWSAVFPDPGGLLINTCNLKLQECDTSDGKGRIDFDEDEMRVTISPGVTPAELMNFFLNNDICFESDTIIANVTYGGTLSGGCHGTGKDQKSMSDEIVSMKVVDGAGNLRTLPPEASRDCGADEILKAAQVSLGLFGVVVEFTMSVKPMSNCLVNNIFDKTVNDVFPYSLTGSYDSKPLADLLDKYWSVEMFWFPFNSLFKWVETILPSSNSEKQLKIPQYPEIPAEAMQEQEEEFTAEATAGAKGRRWPPSPSQLLTWLWSPYADKLWIRGIDNDKDRSEKYTVSLEPGVPFWSKVMDVAKGGLGQALITPLVSNFPGASPFTLLFAFNEVKFQFGTLQGQEVVRTPWAVHYLDGIDLMPCYDMEFAFSIDIKNPITLVKAVQKVVTTTRNYAKFGKFPSDANPDEKINFPLTLCMEMRIMHKSDTLLCPASIVEGGDEHVAYLEVLSTSGTPGYEAYFEEVAKEWTKLGGIPHWQKQWTFLKDTKIPTGTGSTQDIFEYVRDKYGQNLEKFKIVRDYLSMFATNMARIWRNSRLFVTH